MLLKFAIVVIFIARIIFGQLCMREEKKLVPLTLGIFLPNGYKAELGPVINIALHHIQNKSCVLKDYYLSVFFKDTQCKTSVGMKSLFELMNAQPKPFALFGDACTNVNEPVAMASKYWNILHLSYAETHAKFATADSQQMYPTFFRVVPGHRNLNSARCRLIFHFNWKRIGTVKQSDNPRFALPHEPLTTKLEHGYGIKVVYTAGITHDEISNVGRELEELKKRDVRIFIGDFDEILAARIMCEAFQQGLLGENYVWILPGYHNEGWLKNSSRTKCSAEELSSAAEGHFAVQHAPYSPYHDEITISNMTVGQIKMDLDETCKYQCFEKSLRAYVYDGMWTLAMAFHRVTTRYKKTHGSVYDPSDEFSNYTSIHADLLQELSSTSLSGVSGTIRFENNERLGLVEILQWRNNSYITVGYYDGSDDSFSLNSMLDNWEAPLDATILVRQRQHISYALFIILSMLAIIGLLLALFFLSINIRYRNYRFIKMSSPNMNNIIIAGSICTYISVILLGLDTRFISADAFVTLCYVKTWVLCLGFTLAFGSMFSKTWRVHSIFTNIHMNKKAIKDYKLFFFVGVVVLLDIIMLSLWAYISPFSLSVTELEKIHLDNKVIAPEIERCYSENMFVFQAIIFGTKGLLMILGCFLAWETRYVNVPALNDSKYIGMSVYNVVVMCILGLSLAFILENQIDEAYALTSFFIIFCTTLTLCLVFAPKVIELVRNPLGSEPKYRKGLMKSMIGQHSKRYSCQLSVKIFSNEKEHLERLEEENQMLHRFLSEKVSILWELTEKLKQLGEIDQLTSFVDKGESRVNELNVIEEGEHALLIPASMECNGSLTSEAGESEIASTTHESLYSERYVSVQSFPQISKDDSVFSLFFMNPLARYNQKSSCSQPYHPLPVPYTKSDQLRNSMRLPKLGSFHSHQYSTPSRHPKGLHDQFDNRSWRKPHRLFKSSSMN